ncbi:hypothetical protein ACFQ1M_07490 [Sungkyunkwania multivorans]|uniref:Uncharacterized protein n=1 Tax=Sungkyunkwania multivorans TaxID=1173618 RepID=A0ABW3CWA0_9FLAO
MKTLLITLLMFNLAIAPGEGQETVTVLLSFDGYEEGVYYFTDEDENSYEFEEIESKASARFDLTDEKYKGKIFKVTYKVMTEIDELEEEYDSYVIVDLKLAE